MQAFVVRSSPGNYFVQVVWYSKDFCVCLCMFVSVCLCASFVVHRMDLVI